MKKKISILGVTSLALSLFFAPSNSILAKSVSLNNLEEEVTSSRTEYIEYSEYIPNLELPPYYYYYNSGGWSGTLTRQSYMFYETTGVTYVRYAGYVSCSGTCPLPSDEENEK